MQRIIQFGAILVLLCGMMLPGPKQTVQAWTIPTFSIVSVTPDTSVRIRTANFPANETFTVRIGAYGTLGVGGEVVATTNSGAGGSFEETYSIPASLKGSQKLAIRMDSGSGYYSYNWFDNVPGGAPAPTATAAPGSPTATPVPATGGPYYTGIPTFSIVSVAGGSTVTVQTHNYPANQAFTVRIGAYGTLGVGGEVVATTNSGAGGSFNETYTIPSSLANNSQLAIRMESPAGYFAYNWFYNYTNGGTGGPYTATPGSAATAVPVYTGIPTFSISSVVADSTVTIQTSNFPAGTDFKVLIGAYGTLGVGGTEVATTGSGSGGSLSATYTIPDSLKGSQRLAIRLQSTSGFYAYNWFWNNTSGGTGGPVTATATPAPAVPATGGTVYTGIPTFSISSVSKDSTVTIQTNNFPSGTDFKVTMGAYGTLGVGGTEVATTNSGSGGSLSATYTIPDSLKGSQRIAIRMESSSGYFAYNWFWNN